MKRPLSMLAAALAVAATGIAVLRARAPAPAPMPAPAAVAEPAPLEFAAADLMTVTTGTLARVVPLTGTLRPVRQTVVKARVPGELSRVDAREGTTVRRGEVLARIDPLEYETRVRERTAQLQAASAQVDQARRTFDNARALRERNFVSQSALDQVQSAWEVAVATRDATAAQLALARKALADTALVAPIDGVVAERFAQPGEKLPMDARVLSIVDLSAMEIEAPVPAAEVGSVRIGQPVTLRIEGVAQPQVGRIARIAPATQPGTRSVPVYIALENRDPSVRAGLFAQGRLTVETRDNAISVPETAIRDAGARRFVYAIVGDRIVEREVRTGLRDDAEGPARIEIIEGLAAGDRIVAAQLGTLRAGAPVRVTATSGAPAR